MNNIDVEEMPRPPIGFEEWRYISGYSRRLIEEMKKTDHLQQHIGVVAFEMLLHLRTDQRPGVLAYLQRVVRQSSNKRRAIVIEAFSVAGEMFIAKKLSEYRVESLDALPVALRRSLRKEKLRIDLVAVYGEGFQFDEDGLPLEQGVGSPNNMTATAVRAFETNNDCTLPKNGEHLALIKKQYAACQEKLRKAKALKEAAELDELAETRREIEGGE